MKNRYTATTYCGWIILAILPDALGRQECQDQMCQSQFLLRFQFINDQGWQLQYEQFIIQSQNIEDEALPK